MRRDRLGQGVRERQEDAVGAPGLPESGAAPRTVCVQLLGLSTVMTKPCCWPLRIGTVVCWAPSASVHVSRAMSRGYHQLKAPLFSIGGAVSITTL